jgi:valyl-tRNA synthetase
VLETWFSSALWSHSTLGWPNADAMVAYDFAKRLPTSVLVTGFDIIFFWVARMIMMTDHFTGQVPFRDVYITGLVRDSLGQKMSKSKGNVLDPIDLIDGISLDDLVAKRTSGLLKPTDAPKIEKATRKEFPDGIPAFGADALRFTFASLASHGRDIKFDLNRCEGYKNFCNKLWNAARFVLMNCEGFTADMIERGTRADLPLLNPRSPVEHWIVGELNSTINLVETAIDEYRFDLASQAIYEFAWNSLCDWFIEFAKPALQGHNLPAKIAIQQTLIGTLEATLRLLHPVAPFVTEEIWQELKPLTGESRQFLVEAAYPSTRFPLGAIPHDCVAGEKANLLREAVSALRRVRSELGVAPLKPAELWIRGGTAYQQSLVTEFTGEIEFLTRCRYLGAIVDDMQVPPSAVAVLSTEMTLFVPLAGLVDLAAERLRLDKEIKRISVEISKCEGKLASSTFVANAPAAVVVQERQRLVDWSRQRDALIEQRTRLAER